MDTFTQMALGAVIGQAIGYKKLGGKALLFGAVAGGVPDLDVFLTPFLGEDGGWKYHRHFTHALWFGPVFGAISGWALWQHYRRKSGHLWTWIAVMVFACLSHPLLDYCTIYGTQLLAPFSNQRFEISSVSIIDPFYTIVLLLGMLALFIKKFQNHAQAIGVAAFIISTAYLGYGLQQNNKAVEIAEAQLKEQGVAFTKVEAFTSIFQPYVRRIVVREAAATRVGFVSTFAPSHIYWSCRKDIPDAIKQAILKTEKAQTFDWFSMSHLSFAEGKNNEIYVTDARYGIPGDSAFGWWGQIYRVTQAANGEYDAQFVAPLMIERDASGENVANLFKAAFGQPNSFLPVADENCP